MPEVKFTDAQKGRVLQLLDLGWSFWRVQKEFLNNGVEISRGTISRIKNNKENASGKVKKKKIIMKARKMTNDKILRLKNMVQNPNPMTQADMANSLKVSPTCVRDTIKKKLKMKLVKKLKVHFINEASIEKRYRRPWKLYRRLANNR